MKNDTENLKSIQQRGRGFPFYEKMTTENGKEMFVNFWGSSRNIHIYVSVIRTSVVEPRTLTDKCSTHEQHRIALVKLNELTGTI